MDNSKSPVKGNKCVVPYVIAGVTIFLLLVAVTGLIIVKLDSKKQDCNNECETIETTDRETDENDSSNTDEPSTASVEYVSFNNELLQFKFPQSWIAIIGEKTIEYKTDANNEYDYIYSTRVRINNALDEEFIEIIGPGGGHGICSEEIENDNLLKVYSACDITGETGRFVKILNKPVEIKNITIKNETNESRLYALLYSSKDIDYETYEYLDEKTLPNAEKKEVFYLYLGGNQSEFLYTLPLPEVYLTGKKIVESPEPELEGERIELDYTTRFNSAEEREDYIKILKTFLESIEKTD